MSDPTRTPIGPKPPAIQAFHAWCEDPKRGTPRDWNEHVNTHPFYAGWDAGMAHANKIVLQAKRTVTDLQLAGDEADAAELAKAIEEDDGKRISHEDLKWELALEHMSLRTKLVKGLQAMLSAGEDLGVLSIDMHLLPPGTQSHRVTLKVCLTDGCTPPGFGGEGRGQGVTPLECVVSLRKDLFDQTGPFMHAIGALDGESK